MMDAYSFHASDESLDQTYQAMRQAYQRAFKRLGLEAFAVEADSGAIGGSGSHEFMVAADVGEDTILFCPESGYAANVERAQGRLAPAPQWEAPPAAMIVHTPGAGTIAEITAFLNAHGHPTLRPQHMLKTVLYVAKTSAGSHQVAACVRGDREVNEVKLVNALTRLVTVSHPSEGPVLTLRQMTPDEVLDATSAAPGYAGPAKGLKVGMCILDRNLQDAGAMVAGANLTDHHIVGFVPARDAHVTVHYEEIVTIVAGDACAQSGKPLQVKRGIEVGHVFKLGTKYSAAMKAEFTGADQKLHPFVMGCYGIGTSRVVAAAVEQHHDADGICWPASIAPYQCVVVPAKAGDAAVEQAAEGLYRELLAQGIEAVLDDRDVKPGVKFKDWDLIGIPLRIVCGRGIAEGTVELKPRRTPAENIPLAGAAAVAIARLRA